MAANTEAGLVLPVDAVSGTFPHTFPGFPGVFEPGVPVALSALGLSQKDARALVKELGLPLKEAQVDVADEPPLEDGMAASEPEVSPLAETEEVAS